MRTFPRTAGRRAGAALVASVLAAGLAVPAYGGGNDHLKHKHHRVQKQIKQAGHALDDSSARLTRAMARLDAARTQLSAARTELAAAREKLQAARVVDEKMQQRLADAQERLQFARLAHIAGAAAVKRQRSDVADMITTIYEQGDPELLAFSSLMDAQTPEDLIRQQGMQDVVVGEQARTYDDLHASEVLLKVRARQERTAEAQASEAADAAAAHVVVMQDLEDQKREAKDSVVALVAERRTASVKARRAKARDRRTLVRLKREDDRLQRILRERARRARIRALRAAHRGQAESMNTGGFLNRPLPGVITSPFGYRIHPIYHYWGLHDGVDIAAGCGDPLYSAADGTVVQSYWSTVYGHRLVIDNGYAAGVGLATVYNHATSYTVGPGDHVSRGQVIGYVGTTGWSTGCHLHFTVMANGRPVDPQNWF